MGSMKPFLVFLFRQVEISANNAWDLIASEKGYSSLFKAGIVLVSASMIAISQAGAIVYDSDIESHRTKFEIEVLLKGDLKNASQCFSLPSDQIAKCRSAVYELAQVQSAWDLTMQIFTNCFRLGIALLAASVVGFVAVVSRQASRS